MKKMLLLIVAVHVTSILFAQNLLKNGDFSEGGGSLDFWGFTDNAVAITDETGTYARLWSENGVLYQRVEGLDVNVPYQVNIYFRYLRVRQTTGYGFAVESGEPLILPVFTIGATNLSNFCKGNGGDWINLPANLEEHNVVKSFIFTLPEEATAAYIALGTKGALSVYEIDSVHLIAPETSEVQFRITERTSGAPIHGAEVNVHELAIPFLTDQNGEVTVNLLPRDTPYEFNVQRDWYQMLTSSFALGDENLSLSLMLDSIQEVKVVKTRISRYGETDTPYPIFGHMWNSGLNFSDEQVEHIASSFDYIIGGAGIPLNSNLVDRFKAVDPRFQVIRYQGGWSTGRAAAENQKMKLQYYRCGVLAQPVNENDTLLILNSPPDNRGVGLVASEEGNFITWIRIDNELMKIKSVSSQTSYPITVSVERAFDGTVAVSHNANQTVTAPLYTTPPNPGGNNSNLSYFTNIYDYRNDVLRNNALELARSHHYDGIWIDILVGWLGAQNMTGGNYTNWDYRTNTVLSSESIIKYTKEAMQDLYYRFFSRMGYYPVVYGNNVLFSHSFNPGSRGYVMLQTPEHQKVIDGFCHENTWGHMTDDSSVVDNDGEPVLFDGKVIIPGTRGRSLEWYVEQTWIDKNIAVALLAQNDLPTQPMTINAGFKNQWFAENLTRDVRYEFNKYSYASYLLCVNVSPDSLISARMGVSAMAVNDGALTVKLDSFFYHPIGIPLEQHQAHNFRNYRIGSYNLYARRFSNGLVLVNPFKNAMTVPVPIATITGNDSLYYDPDNHNQTMLTVKLQSRESLILLKSDADPTDIRELITDQSPELLIYPVPARQLVNFQVVGIPGVEGLHEVIIYATDGFTQSRVVHFEHGNAQLSLTGIKPGLYAVFIPRLNILGRLMVY